MASGSYWVTVTPSAFVASMLKSTTILGLLPWQVMQVLLASPGAPVFPDPAALALPEELLWKRQTANISEKAV